MRTIGVDLSTSSARTALATIEWFAESAVVTELVVGVPDEPIIRRAATGAAVGLDSPLGWPDAFVEFVREQQGGTLVEIPEQHQPAWRRSLAYRATDDAVREILGLVPLSVSTDRLGLVAMRAAALMAGILGEHQPLDRSGRAPVIEIYPAASLRAWELPAKGYKTDPDARRHVLRVITERAPWLDLGAHAEPAVEVDHAFDALIAALSVRAWSVGRYWAPPARLAERARREGWIVIPVGGLPDLLASPIAPPLWVPSTD